MALSLGVFRALISIITADAKPVGDVMKSKDRASNGDLSW